MKNKEKYLTEILESFANNTDNCSFRKNYILKKSRCNGISCKECNNMIKEWFEDMLELVETIKEDEKPEMVNHPQHYAFKYEPIDVINDWGLDFNLGNTVKYIARCERKGNKIQDLEKAKFYLEDEIRRLKEKSE